jgi:hypothetical protein
MPLEVLFSGIWKAEKMQACLKIAGVIPPPEPPNFCLIRKTIREPWKLSMEQRAFLVDYLFRIIRAGNSVADSLKAVSLILEMEKINLAQIACENSDSQSGP